MTTAQVKALIGKPLYIQRWPDDDFWAYSDRSDCTCSYWVRGVSIRDDKVVGVSSFYYYE